MNKDTWALEVAEITLHYNGVKSVAEETYGYTSSVDNIINMRTVVKLVKIDPKDISIDLRINRKHMLHGNLVNIDDLMNEWLPVRS